MNTERDLIAPTMEADGWTWEATCLKEQSGRELKRVAPWMTVCCTESDYNMDCCDVWSREAA